jgi:hypothetical protein
MAASCANQAADDMDAMVGFGRTSARRRLLPFTTGTSQQ